MKAASRGFDAGKRVNGRKRHNVVDTLGLLLVAIVTATSATDREIGQRLLARLRERHGPAETRPSPSEIQRLLTTVGGVAPAQHHGARSG
ncbi:transposase [Streptacidiphilus anmyonensis]|uniref:transposase n=1 Tax=Streptacidiphilus anmyonensis TaxID=405782 RepID=UPI000A0676A8|nr:transposase [Streptacidiphilus anmyonensis]